MTVSTSTRTIDLADGLAITIDEQGDAAAAEGSGVLLLHGGAGPRTVTGLGAALAEHAYVITPTHPGFDGTPRLDWTDTIADLAVAYLDLLDKLGLRHVLIAGSSIGGWIAAEMALRDNHSRISGLILLNAVGINGNGTDEVVDIRTINPADVGRLSFANPALRPDFSAFSDEQRAVMAVNQQTLATYGGDLFTHDPKLRRRLHRVTVPVLVVWGEQDGIAPLEYGRVYADSFPHARFEPVPDAGHFPHMEQPSLTMKAIGEFVNTDVKP
jgi:pimeloyl-ACP methyl ester carboxylesterase